MCSTFHSSNSVRGLPEGHSSAAWQWCQGSNCFTFVHPPPSLGAGNLFSSPANHVHNTAGIWPVLRILSVPVREVFALAAVAGGCSVIGTRRPARDWTVIWVHRVHRVPCSPRRQPPSTHNRSSRSQCATLIFLLHNRPQKFKLSISGHADNEGAHQVTTFEYRGSLEGRQQCPTGTVD